MKTLIIVSHPEEDSSMVQQFLKAGADTLKNVDRYHLESTNKPWSVSDEQNKLKEYDRLIFQFPMYWYSAPHTLKKWIDVVFTHSFYKKELSGKELGIVVSMGVSESEFEVGKSESFTLSELFRPFEALANKCHMTFLPIFPISLFVYKTDLEQKRVLVEYQRYLTMPNQSTFQAKEQWFVERLEALEIKGEYGELLMMAIEEIKTNRQHLDDLNLALKEMKSD
ncbi:MAG: NAD(P)H-dependent oxidoreductase [Vagococcus sp.]